MGDIKTSVIIDLAGNLEARSRRYRRAFGTFSRGVTKDMRQMASMARTVGRGIGRLGNQYTALIGLGSGAAAARSVLTLQERTTRLGVQSGLNDADIEKLKRQIFAASSARDTRIKPDELLSAIEKIVEKTGDLELARDNMRNIALAIQATGAAGSDIGALVADMQQKFGLAGAREFLATLDALVLQGKAGSFELRELATQGERVTAAYAATGRVGPTAVREMGAILQMVKRGTGSAEEASTAYERLLSTLTQEKSAQLEKAGIKIWDQDELAKGNKIARAVPDIIKDIIKRTGGDTEKLAQVFDIRALRALIPFAIEYQRTGGFGSFDSFLGVSGTGSELKADSARVAKIGNAAIDNLLGTTQKELDKKLSTPLKKAADAVNQYLGGDASTGTDPRRFFPSDSGAVHQFGSDWRGKLQIEIEGAPARVKNLQSSDSRLDIDADTGKQMVAP